MSEQTSQDTDQQEETGTTFKRGTSLSIFHSDRREDFTALFFAAAIALGVYLYF
jgi:hypothetical protein